MGTLGNIASSAPVFVVGQPRSGSTLLTRVLNESPDLFVINDFYGLQKIDAEDLWGPLDAAGAARVAQITFERIEIRATQETGKTLEQSIELSAEQVETLRSFSMRTWEDGLRWHQVLSAVMGKAAELAGAARWGYNTPQDYLHLERLYEAFPEAQVLFLLRQPEKVLSSYKNVSGPWHEADRYNPLAIGMAWKAASKAFNHWADARPGQVHFQTYEALTGERDSALKSLGQFLHTDFPPMDFDSFGRNTSHDDHSVKKPVSPSELWLCEKMIGVELEKRGYAPSKTAKPRLADTGTLLGLGARSGSYIAKTMLDSDRRKRVMRMVGGQ